jgi:predicted tellurium resistance membrane protein TerC
MELALFSDILISLLALIVLEIILGVDNLVFISILSSRLPQAQQKTARRVGLLLALVTRLLLLASAVWLVHLTQPLFNIGSHPISCRDLFLFFGGLFLLVKGTWEILKEIDHAGRKALAIKYATFTTVILQIALFDVIFSLDSILTAVSLTNHFAIMATAIIIAVIVMLFASEHIHYFIQKYPTIKMLALAFLLLIGVVLIADGLSIHIPRGYVYFALFFSLMVETLNNVMHHRRKRVET